MNEAVRKTSSQACPICGKTTDIAFKPFCSKRCADVDLGRWLGERYVVTEPLAPDDEADRLPDEKGDGSA